MSRRVIQLLSLLSILPIVATILFATRASSDPPPPQSQDCVLLIPGIPGDSHVIRDGIDVNSFAWGVQNPATVHHPDRGPSRFNDLTITKSMDRSSPLLMLAAAEGERLPSATVVSTLDGGVSPYLTVTLTEVLVSNYNTIGNCDGGLPIDQVSLNFGRIRFSYQSQPRDGGVSGEPVTRCWDTLRHRACD